MPLQNRATPLGELVADAGRGLVFGNRGCLHDSSGRIRRRFDGRRWIACRLEFRGRSRAPLMRPGRYTELFFLDEATAFASGHRPCAECRREDYARFLDMWRALHPADTRADAVDARLHSERVHPGTRAQRHHEASLDDVPDGAYVLDGVEPCVVAGPRLLTWTPGGYTAARPRPARRRGVVITPPSLVAILRQGWEPAVPLLHPSAQSCQLSDTP